MRVLAKTRGSFKNLERYLQGQSRTERRIRSILNRYGQAGVTYLAQATPKDTGETADSWYYTVEKSKNGYKLSWRNSKAAGRVPLVVLLQYGHGTAGGTFVQGIDFINPALRPTVNKISEAIWKEVKYD